MTGDRYEELAAARRIRWPLPEGEWRAINSPADRIPSHGTDQLGQRYAYDITGVDEAGRLGPKRGWRAWLWREDPGTFPGFGSPVVAPADGVVVEASDGIADRPAIRSVPLLLAFLARMLTFAVRARDDFARIGIDKLLGNHVIVALDKADGTHAAHMHLRHGSLRVKQGDRVVAGQVIATLGNSGNTTQPHLHFQLMDGPDPATALGVPAAFDIEVARDGRWEPAEALVPAAADRVRAPGAKTSPPRRKTRRANVRRAKVAPVVAVRAIAPDELDWFAGLTAELPGIGDQVRDLWEQGSGRPEWTLVATVGDRPIGRLAMFAEAIGCGLSERECRLAGLWLDWTDAARQQAARALFDAVSERARELAPTVIERRLNPEIHADIPAWRAVLDVNRFAVFQEKEGFVWTDDGRPLPRPQRLDIRPLAEVGRDAFAAAMARCIVGTLDRNDAYYVERCTPDGWAREMLGYFEDGDESSWLLGYAADGTLAGYVAVGGFDPGVGTIVHVGVTPEWRGQGMIDDLLRAAAIAARERGYRSILSDVDVENAPMLAAMERNGHRAGIRPWHVWVYRRPV